MKAFAIYPGRHDTMNTAHLRDVPMPTVADVPNGRGVLVKMLRCGVDGTDKELLRGEYGHAPDGFDYMIEGHENFGQVVAVGPNVPSLIAPGALVVATVRRPGQSIYDRIGLQDMTTDEVYFERGISRLHGFLTEYYVEDADYLVVLPASLREVGVLLEPMSIAQKGINQAFEIQRRLRVWEPRRAAVLGAGTIGLLTALTLRLRGFEVICYSQTRPPYLNSELIEAIGAQYVCSQDVKLIDTVKTHGPFDVMYEATGYSPLVWEAAEALGKNGVLILASITGGDRRVEIPSDRVNQSFVLGNKLMVGIVNASRHDFQTGVNDIIKSEAQYPGWLGRLLTHPIQGLANYTELVDNLFNAKGAIKVFVEIGG